MGNNVNSKSGIGDESYFLKNYISFLESHDDPKLIFMDINKFKQINDVYGHNTGDTYLCVFSIILLKMFEKELNGIAARLHGDEFAVLTNDSTTELKEKFEKITKLIEGFSKGKTIPSPFTFSAGIVPASKNYEESQEQADYMMYYAKNNGLGYQFFDQQIWDDKQAKEDFVKDFQKMLEEGNLGYLSQVLHDSSGAPKDIQRVYTRNADGSALLDNGRYGTLRKTPTLYNFDSQNFEDIITKFGTEPSKKIIRIDYKSLVASPELFEKLLRFKCQSSNTIIGIDLGNIVPSEHKAFLSQLERAKKMGYPIALENIDGDIADNVWTSAGVNYVSPSAAYWKRALIDPDATFLVQRKSDMIANYGDGAVLLFGCVESEKEFDFLKRIAPQNALFSGKYFDTSTGR